MSKSKANYRVIFIVLAVVAAVALISTAGYLALKYQNKISKEEATQILSDLVPKSLEINEIIWGEGFSPAEDANGVLEGVTAAQYRKVSPDSKYQTKAELEAAIYAVYSKSYVDTSVRYAAFEGTEGVTEELGRTYPRYAEGDNGELLCDINPDTNTPWVLPEVNYSFDSATVTKVHFSKVTVELTVERNGVKNTEAIVLVKQDNGWRLDSPTY